MFEATRDGIETRLADSAPSSAAALAQAWRGLDLLERLAALRSHISGRMVFTTSFGLEDQAIAHAVAARLDCCAVRKVAPLSRALTGCAAWISGLRADQSAERAGLGLVSFDDRRRLIKANPLFDWTREATFAFVRAHGVPYNPLHDRGFLSIGCAPCTRAVAPGEPERAGRWWWEQAEKKECGLHL